jgi:hypothetical protein
MTIVWDQLIVENILLAGIIVGSIYLESERKAKALADFISWAITDGQKLAPNLHYVPLPAVVVKHNQDTLNSLTFKGTPLYTGQ